MNKRSRSHNGHSQLLVGRTLLSLERNGISIFWKEKKITAQCGLNCAINTLGLWTDSAKADWAVLEKTNNSIKAEVRFHAIPVSQVWTLIIDDIGRIKWDVEFLIEEWIYIDECRFLFLLNPFYKKWISEYKEGEFFRFDHNWQDLYLDSNYSNLVGAKRGKEGILLPFIFVEPVKPNNYFPVIQNSPLEFNLHVIGFRTPDFQKKEYIPGSYKSFSGTIHVSGRDNILETKREISRRNILRKNLQKKINFGSAPKVILANLPWKVGDRLGVRAGSRWPHIKDKSEGNYLPFPFFLAYATSLLKQNNIKADIVDAVAEDISDREFLDSLTNKKVDLFIAETSVPSFYYDMSLLEKISEFGISIVICGPNSLSYSKEFLKEHSFINFVMFGEYEMTLLELVKSLSRGYSDLSDIDGLIWKNDKGEVIKNKPRKPINIDSLPWPERESLPMGKYWDLPGNIPYPSVQMVASRGCPFGCNFCLWPQVMYKNNDYRTRDVKDVVDEMEYLVKCKGFKSVYFDDDTFNIGRERVIKLCREIKRRNLDSIPWAVMARADLMDKELLTILKSAGLWAVKYGVESVSEDLLKNYSKNLNFKKSVQMIKETKKLGIKCHLTFAFGVDGETQESIKRTINYSLKLDPDSVQYSILTPFPGTKLYADLDMQERIITRDWSLYDGHNGCVFKPDHMSSANVLEAKHLAYRMWGDYLRKKRGLFGNLKRFRFYLAQNGLKYVLYKTFTYIDFILFKKRKYLDGNSR